MAGSIESNCGQAGDSGRRRSRSYFNRFFVGIGRGIGGALLFALPMFMTMEMWALGFYIDRFRLLVLLLANIPLLVVLCHHIGFEETFSWKEDLRDAAIAYAIGIITSATVLFSVGVLRYDLPFDQLIGIVALQSVPASIGALLGRSQLNGDNGDGESCDQHERDTGYAGELFMMVVGALFLSLNVAPTEEMILLAYKMTPWHGLVVVMFSIIMMHAFVYAVSFKGSHEMSDNTPRWHALIRFTLPGYVIALLVSCYTLWTFQRLGDTSMTQTLMVVVVLSFPGALGAAAARLIL